MACPDENLLSGFMQGLLSGADRAAIERHLDTCSACAGAVVAVARAVDPVASTVQVRARSMGTGLTAAAPSPVARSPDGQPTAGERVGRYEVAWVLGRGGMGVVYEARDPALDRRVALKVMRADLSVAAAGSERLVREARALARLSHPNVVAVHDVGEDAGRLFVAMEMVRGSTLRAWQVRAPRAWHAIVEAFLQAGKGLGAAHAAGILHRDFKPENVLIGEDGRVRVGDFGLARVVAAETSPSSERVVLGTPAYMAPEQLRGEAVGPVADQFSFCVALYEALWGARPYGDADVGALRAELTHPAEPPSDSPVPEWVFPVLAQGLHLDPARRHASMAALLDRIEQGLRPGPDGHVRANAIMQVLLCVLHVAMTTFLVWAISSDSSGSEIATDPLGAARHDLTSGIALVISVGLVLMLLSGWLPLGAVWTAVNAWGLWRGRRWALWSTIVYAVVSLPTCLGTPYAVYALFSLWGRARARRKKNRDIAYAVPS
jgi:predicted Ser/Thr protein kinase